VAIVNAPVSPEAGALAAAWHPVADAAELADEPLGVLLLGRPWVLVRLGGQVAAFEDRCPHRLAPLSAGWVDGDQLRCRYHGWSYGSDGRCTLVPANGPGAPVPPGACLRRPAGIVERYGLIWLAPEEPLGDILPFPEWDDPAFDRSWAPPRRTPSDAAQLAANFLDASQTPALPPGQSSPLPPQVDSRVDHPAAVVRLTFDVPPTGDRLAVLFACQPETRDSTRVYKLMAERRSSR
jgi:nitrite reductase/ring-hydroxylating ferredoxin subunit